MNYKPVIGLEVHVELKTKSKMFCGCSANYFGQKPNTYTCPVCLGLPGALPVPNKKAIEWCVMIGIALNCKINNFSKFDRKNYFYPDLPKGYQISQYDQPFCSNGYVILSEAKDLDLRLHLEGDLRRHLPGDQKKRIRIRRVHMEEDTAKLLHRGANSLIDFNRSGVPLVEIVTEPDFENARQVVEYLKKLQQIVRYLNVSDADMEKGEMRLEPNISLLKRNTTNTTNKQILPIYKVEVKNINSFRFVEKAIEYETKRQEEILNEGKVPTQETRGWDDDKQKTVTQRVKEEANDYRYFPEPDIPPIRLAEYQISNIKNQIGELPDEKQARFQKEYCLSAYNSEILARERSIADFFEETIKVGKIHGINPKQIANNIINKKVDIDKTLPAQLIEIIINDGKKSSLDKNKLKDTINKVLVENSKAVNDYKRGKVQVIGFLIGKVKQHYPNSDTNQIKVALEKQLK